MLVIVPGLSDRTSTGVWTYTKNIINFCKIQNIKYIVVEEPSFLKKNTLNPYLRKLIYISWLNTFLFIKYGLNKNNIIHFTNFNSFIIPSLAKNIVTIHDLYAPKELISKYFQSYLKLSLFFAALNSDLIIAISQEIKQELITKSSFNIIFKKKLIHLYQPSSNMQTLEEKYFLKDSDSISILCIGTLSPMKNFLTGIKAVERVIKNFGIYNLELNIIGSNAEDTKNIKKYIKKNNLSKYIKLRGYVDEKTKRKFFYNSNLILHTSIYEGYGITLLDAIENNKIFLCSDIPINREILNNCRIGSDFIYGSPFDFNSLAIKIKWLLNNKDLSYKPYTYWFSSEYLSNRYLNILKSL